MRMSPGDGATLDITESGWDADNLGLASSFEHCEGWTHFADHQKLYLEQNLEMNLVAGGDDK